MVFGCVFVSYLNILGRTAKIPDVVLVQITFSLDSIFIKKYISSLLNSDLGFIHVLRGVASK